MPHVLVNGARLFYDRAGVGPPVVFLHGHTLDHHLWDDQVAPVSRAHTVIRMDLRGHGESEAAGSEYNAVQFADDLHGLIRALGLERPTIVGHSIGGNSALEFALEHPADLRALVLVSSGVEGFATSPKLAAHMQRQAEAFRAHGRTEAWVAARLEGMVYAGTPDLAAKQERVRAMLRRWSGASDQIFAPEPVRPVPQLARLGTVRVPALIVVGEHDGGVLHRAAVALAAGIPEARRVVLPDAGHLAPLENPDAFSAALLDFLSRVDSSA